MPDAEELYIDSLSCRFGSRMVLGGVYLSCKRGQVVGLLGRNGSGKSTFLKVVFGQYKGLYKHCKLNGKLFRKGYQTKEIAYLPQDYLLPGHLRLRTALKLMNLSNHGQALIEIPLIRDSMDVRMHTLSGGIRRVIEALLIIYSDATYVLLDEPFSNIAPTYTDELQHHINLMRSEKGFVITDHYYDRVMEISDQTWLIHNGCNYQINEKEDLYVHGYIPESALENF